MAGTPAQNALLTTPPPQHHLAGAASTPALRDSLPSLEVQGYRHVQSSTVQQHPLHAGPVQPPWDSGYGSPHPASHYGHLYPQSAAPHCAIAVDEDVYDMGADNLNFGRSNTSNVPAPTRRYPSAQPLFPALPPQPEPVSLVAQNSASAVSSANFSHVNTTPVYSNISNFVAPRLSAQRLPAPTPHQVVPYGSAPNRSHYSVMHHTNMHSLPKLPAFSLEHPEFWFALIEQTFVYFDLDDHAQYLCLINNLHSRVDLIYDLVQFPPSVDKYATAKQTILDRVAKSTRENVQRLVYDERLGDKSPSQLWRSLRQLAGEHDMSDRALLAIWMEKLPLPVQTAVSAHEDRSARECILAADSLFSAPERTPCQAT